MTVQMTLKDGFIVEGKVKQVVPEHQSLVLQNGELHIQNSQGSSANTQAVFSPQNGWRSESWMVQGQSIADLQIVNTTSEAAPVSAIRTNAPPLPPVVPTPPASDMPIRTAKAQQARQPSDFVDPAILSYGRSPLQSRAASKPPDPSTPVKSMLAKAAESLPNNGSPFVGEAGKSSGSRKPSTAKGGLQQEPGAHKVAAAQTQHIEADGTQEGGQWDTVGKKKARRSQKKKAASGVPELPPVMNVEVSRNGNDMDGSVKRGKGWRQTPLLQPSPQTSSPQSKGSMKKTRRQQQEEREGQKNGWATEEATDIQDMGEFDFEANHKLFDKKQVFDQLRQGDTTADEDRLVSHNKLHRPGTYGGKNLHPTENVLSPTLAPKHHSNELDSTSDADTELNLANGRSSSRHSSTRVAMKKQPSRQNSAQVDPRPHPLSASISSDRPLSRTAHSLSGKPGRSVPSITTSPMVDRTHSPHSALSTTKSHATPLLASQHLEPHLAISQSLVPCPVLLPTALEALEKETVAHYGLTHDALTEIAARCIAETAMNVLESSTNSRRGSRANTLQRGMSMNTGLGIDHSSPPVIVIIAGNHPLGARAIAAARHLICRQTKIILAEAQYESHETQDAQMRTQLAILKRLIKSGASIKRGPWRRASGYIKNLPSPPALIIDALLGGSTYDSLLASSNPDHASESQKETREMIGWANRSRAPVLSIGCPSGVSGTDGSTTTFEGEPLAVRPDRVLCLAAPMQGILEAIKGGERWEVSLADVGVNIALKSEEAVAFGAQWVVDVRFVEGDGQGVEQ